MRKLLLLTLTLLLSGEFAGAQSVVCRITGEVEDKTERQVILYDILADSRRFELDERKPTNECIVVEVKDGRFMYNLKTDGLRCYQIVLRSEYERGSMRTTEFIVENGHVHIVIPKSKDECIRVESDGKEAGMEMKYRNYADSVYAIYAQRFQRLDAERDSLHKTKLYYKPMVYEIEEKLKSDRETNVDSLRRLLPDDVFSDRGSKIEAAYFNLEDEYRAEQVKWLKTNKCFYGLSLIIEGASYKRYPKLYAELIKAYFDNYAHYMPKHPYSKRAAQEALAATKLMVGKPYIDYMVRGTDGRDVKLSSLFKGKVIYINLWASWCGSCRKHAKSIIPVYERYKDKGFQIIGIAREYKTGAMEEAAKHDGYTWTNLVELNDQHQIWPKNGMNSVGGGFLIKQDGTIVAIYPQADELEHILKSLL